MSTVRQHPRRLPSGRVVTVRQHPRRGRPGAGQPSSLHESRLTTAGRLLMVGGSVAMLATGAAPLACIAMLVGAGIAARGTLRNLRANRAAATAARPDGQQPARGGRRPSPRQAPQATPQLRQE